mgnify:CR=1 FL=1
MKMNLTTSEKNRGIVRFLLMSLLLSILILPAHAQDRVTVSGQLTDSSQTPLIGASVIEKGTTNGVTTDADGRYQISVKPDGVIDPAKSPRCCAFADDLIQLTDAHADGNVMGNVIGTFAVGPTCPVMPHCMITPLGKR